MATTIQPYQREPNSGSRELMDSLVMHGTRMIEGPNLLVFSMIGLVEAVRYDPAGIGYSVYYYVTFMTPTHGDLPGLEPPGLKLAAIEGVPPTYETIQQRTYPLTAEVYVVTRGDMPADSTAIGLRDWLLTPAGQAVVAESGYVALSAAATRP